MSKVNEFVASNLGKDLTLCRDYPSIINWSISQIAKWTSSWTDFSITDPGILFVNANAYLYDIINYTLDEAYLNNILRYTKSMESLHFMAKFVGLTLPAYTSSIAKVRVTNPLSENILIPEHFPLFVNDKATGETLWFYSLNESLIPSNAFDYIYMIEGERREVNTTFGSFDSHYEFTIPQGNVGINSVIVYVKKVGEDEFIKLPQIEDAFLNTDPVLCFSVHYGYNKVSVKLPPGSWEYLNQDSPIKILYGNTKGSSGNLGEVVATAGEQILIDNTPVESKLSFTIISSEGGSDPLNLEDTRVFIGNNSWRVDSLITTEDFNNLATLKFPEIVRFVPIQKQGEEVMDLYYVPVEGLPADRLESLEQELYDECSPKMFGGTKLQIREIGYSRVSFRLEVILETNSSDLTAIRRQIEDILENYFDRTTQPQGMVLRRSEIITRLEQQIPEIDYVACSSPSSDMTADAREIFVLSGAIIDFTQKRR